MTTCACYAEGIICAGAWGGFCLQAEKALVGEEVCGTF